MSVAGLGEQPAVGGPTSPTPRARSRALAPVFQRLTLKYSEQLAADEDGDAVSVFGMLDPHQRGKADVKAIAVRASEAARTRAAAD